MSDAYWKTTTKSYSNQQGGITIPAEELNDIVTITLGFQPMGIASKSIDNGTRIAIAAYFEPAICLVNVKLDQEGLQFQINWIRGVQHGIERVRLFPDIFQPGVLIAPRQLTLPPGYHLGLSKWGLGISTSCPRQMLSIPNNPGIR